MSNETMRAEFEAWATKECYPIDRYTHNPNSYEFLETRRMWQGWQAALAARQPVGQEPGCAGMLPDALVPVADEWYQLCERRFAAQRITITGELAEALVKAIDTAPPAPAAQNGKLVGWWNGIMPDVTDRSDSGPSVRWGADAETSGHDIPLYDGINPIHYQQPAPAAVPVDGIDWKRLANEWADCACNGLQWLKNVRDGMAFEGFGNGIPEMQLNIERIRGLYDAMRAAHPQPAAAKDGA